MAEVLERAIQRIVYGIVAQPRAVVVTMKAHGEQAVLQVCVAAPDITRLVGSEGRTFKALRELVRAFSGKQNHEVVVEIAA